jgi:hypothetical protein
MFAIVSVLQAPAIVQPLDIRSVYSCRQVDRLSEVVMKVFSFSFKKSVDSLSNKFY